LRSFCPFEKAKQFCFEEQRHFSGALALSKRQPPERMLWRLFYFPHIAVLTFGGEASILRPRDEGRCKLSGRYQMHKLLVLGLVWAPLFFGVSTGRAQDKEFQTKVLQKLEALELRLNEMDKRYEVRFATIEAKLEAIDQRFDAVNRRIDDKFNLNLGLVGSAAVILAVLYVYGVQARFINPPKDEDIQRLEKELEKIETQLTQLSQAIRPNA
jgi:chaperonin cofactor prefoldin